MESSASRQRALGTLSFAVCFTAWGLISAFAPEFRQLYSLSSTEVAFLVAVPVLLGSVARLPMGLLTDRFGGRAVYSLLTLLVAIPVAIVPMVSTYQALIVTGFFLGMAGSSFAVGVGFVSPWFPRDRQGSALGVYAMGNIGQSIAVFLGPLLATVIGWPNVFTSTSVLLVAWAIVFGMLARNAPGRGAPKTIGATLAVLRREPLT